jgi:isopenicillin N synthase-like dioxygenase
MAGLTPPLLLPQVQTSAGMWHALHLQPNQVAVLAGYTLSYATGGQVRTCRHRVVSGLTDGQSEDGLHT